MDNMEEMDKFLEKYNFPKLNQEEKENLNISIKSSEIETIIRNLPANKSPGPDSFTVEFYQKFRDELTPIQSDFDVDLLVMSMCRVFSCVVERGCLL